MTNKNNLLTLKYDPYANHCCSWSISDDIWYGSHNFDDFKRILLNGTETNPRRYAEVLYHKTKKSSTLLEIISKSLEERAKYDVLGAKRLTDEFIDWGIRIDGKDVMGENLKVRGAS